MTDPISRNVYTISSTSARLIKSNRTFKQDRRTNPGTRGSVSWEGTDVAGGLGAGPGVGILGGSLLSCSFAKLPLWCQ